MTLPIIYIKDLQKTYRQALFPSVVGLSLSIEKGMFFGLLGPNGAGKTTTISILCGLLSYDEGLVKINGLEVRHMMKDIKPLIGIVPQDIALYPELTVVENLKFFGGMYGLTSIELNNQIETYLLDFGLTTHSRMKVEHLSGGLKRQVNLITALLHRPSLLFLDEPTVGVDVHSRQTIVKNLQILHQNGMTIVYTSHDIKEAEQLCTHVALINHGKIICNGNPKELVAEASVSTLEDLFIKETTK